MSGSQQVNADAMHGFSLWTKDSAANKIIDCKDNSYTRVFLWREHNRYLLWRFQFWLPILVSNNAWRVPEPGRINLPASRHFGLDKILPRRQIVNLEHSVFVRLRRISLLDPIILILFPWTSRSGFCHPPMVPEIRVFPRRLVMFSR